ncbi:hypothetical protein ABPG74_004913 [Tetrahymena malaccensis]
MVKQYNKNIINNLQNTLILKFQKWLFLDFLNTLLLLPQRLTQNYWIFRRRGCKNIIHSTGTALQEGSEIENKTSSKNINILLEISIKCKPPRQHLYSKKR